MKAVITFLDMRFWVIRYQWGRKWLKGKYYLIDPQGLSMSPFWSDQQITSCQSKTLQIEEY